MIGDQTQQSSSQSTDLKTHTAGPWRLDDENNENVVHRYYHIIEAGTGCCNGGASDGFTASGWMSIENGRLIAAAPDLLEALKAVVAVADRDTVEFDQARAAIAKAEGRHV